MIPFECLSQGRIQLLVTTLPCRGWVGLKLSWMWADLSSSSQSFLKGASCSKRERERVEFSLKVLYAIALLTCWGATLMAFATTVQKTVS